MQKNDFVSWVSIAYVKKTGKYNSISISNHATHLLQLKHQLNEKEVIYLYL